MRLVIQRVNHASVEVVHSQEIVGKIDKGLLILVGIGKKDTKEIAQKLAQKVVKMRIMADKEEKMNLSVKDEGEILAVSQFTLYANTDGGNRPSFLDAALPDHAKLIYQYFVEEIKNNGVKVETGSFGNYMKIAAELDGPVTILLES